MIEQLFVNVLEITAVVSPILLVLFLLSRYISRFYSAKWSYFVWLVLAVRLIIPFNFTLPNAPVSVEVPAQISQPAVVSLVSSAVISHDIQSITTPAPIAPAAPVTSVAAGFSIMQIASIVWVCGIILFLCFHFTGYFLFLRRVKHWRHFIKNPEITEIFSQKCKEMHIQRKIPLYKCNRIDSPMLVGFFKPMILIPDCPVTGEQLGIILAHELIHYKRHDLWYQLFLICANAMHWFNPLVYLMVRQADNDLEFFCDEEIIKNRPALFRQTYGEAIFVFLKRKVRTQTSFSTNFFGGSKAMKQRFVRLYDNKKRKYGWISMTAILCVTVLAGTCVACTVKPASQPNTLTSEPASSVSEQASSVDTGSSSTPSSAAVSSKATGSKTNQTAVGTTSATKTPIYSSTDGTPPVSKETKAFYTQAANLYHDIVYDFSLDNSEVVRGNVTYSRVSDKRFSTKEKLRAYLNNYFTKDFTANELSVNLSGQPKYIDINGSLYQIGYSKSGDISYAGHVFGAVTASDTLMKMPVKVYYQKNLPVENKPFYTEPKNASLYNIKEYMFEMVKEDGKWKFSKFYSLS